MAKVMLVEDDNNLREIYGARLLAEGYEIVSAKDGEEALALAVKEKPDLIITDVMMPKISGFDMLDILRSTPETKNTKVIMMTALSQAEDKTRADKLGADRYLVKSQVTLEDVAKTAREVLGGDATTAATATAAAPTDTPAPTPAPAATVTPTEPAVTPTPTPTPTPVQDTAAATAAAPTDTPAPTPAPAATVTPTEPAVTPTPTPTPTPVQDTAANQTVLDNAVSTIAQAGTTNQDEKPAQEQRVIPGSEAGSKTSVHTKVITPINDITKPSDQLQQLLQAEESKAAAPNPTPTTAPVPVAPAPAPAQAAPAVNDVTPPAPAAPIGDENIAPDPPTITPTAPPTPTA